MPEPFLFYSLAKLKSLTRHKTKNAPLSGSIISLQRERDSNPRYVAIYTLSKRAPSATRPPLHRVQDKWMNFVDKPYVLRAATYLTRP